MRASILFTALALALSVNADIAQQVINDPAQSVVSDTIQQQTGSNENEPTEATTDIIEEEEEEATTDPIQGCINGLTAIQPQFDELTTKVYSFNSTEFNQGLDDAVTIAANISYIINNLELATPDCCRMPEPISEEDSNRINGELDVLTPLIKKNMKAFNYEKRAFSSVYFALAIVKGHVEVLHTNTTATLNCILKSTPPETVKATKRYVKQIEYAFEDTRGFLDM